jgi:hypothetical protein
MEVNQADKRGKNILGLKNTICKGPVVRECLTVHQGWKEDLCIEMAESEDN